MGSSGTSGHDGSHPTDALISSRKVPLWRQRPDEERAVIDVNDPREVYEQRGQCQILDVREPYEWEAGHIEEAVHIPLGEVMAGGERGRLNPARRVVVVCKTGNRSEVAALMLQARGFDAHNLEGGTESWVTAGLPIVASEGGPGRVV